MAQTEDNPRAQVEHYINALPEDDRAIVLEHLNPVIKNIEGMRATPLGASKSNEKAFEDAVRERCVDVPEKRIRRIINVLHKAANFIQPRIFEEKTGLKSGRLQSGICVPGSNCHYTKEFLMGRVLFVAKGYQPADFSISPLCRHSHDHMSATQSIPPINLSRYTQMKIIELAPETANYKRVIYCTILYDGNKTRLFYTVVEDDFGQCAMLSIRNATVEFQESLKKGVKIAIADPYYELGTRDDCYFIKMDCPTNIILMETNSALSVETEEDHKLEGNKHFKALEFAKSIRCYTKAISLNKSNPVYFSNRALCYLKLGLFEKALQDAETTVQLDPNTYKYQHRLATAWSSLGNHVKSVEILENVQTESGCLVFLNKERKLLSNSRGVYNLDEIAQLAKRGETLELADFIGPIRIDKSPTKGHSIFATRYIHKGELICFQKAFAYLGPNKKDSLKEKAESINFADNVKIPVESIVQKLKVSLTEEIDKSKLFAFRLFQLITKHTSSEPISIELYRSQGYELVRGKVKPSFPMDTLDTLIEKNVLVIHSPASPHRKTEEKIISGIWPIRAFLNHSCLPNTLPTCYNDFCILRACVAVPKGTELTSQWVSIKFDLEERQAMLKKMNLSCDCQLCKFESNPKNKTLLQRAVLLRERAHKRTSIEFNPDYPILQDCDFELLNEAFSLAEEMKLGPTQFNVALWQAMQYLLSSSPKPTEYQRLHDAFCRAKSYLCDLELQHQRDFWDIWYLFISMCQFPISQECRDEIRFKHLLISNYLTNIP